MCLNFFIYVFNLPHFFVFIYFKPPSFFFLEGASCASTEVDASTCLTLFFFFFFYEGTSCAARSWRAWCLHWPTAYSGGIFFLCALFFSVCAVCVFVSVCCVCVCIFVCVVLVIDVSLAIKLSFSRTIATHNICTHTHTRTTHARTHTHTQVTMSGTAANGGLVGEHELGTNSN